MKISKYPIVSERPHSGDIRWFIHGIDEKAKAGSAHIPRERFGEGVEAGTDMRGIGVLCEFRGHDWSALDQGDRVRAWSDQVEVKQFGVMERSVEDRTLEV